MFIACLALSLAVQKLSYGDRHEFRYPIGNDSIEIRYEGTNGSLRVEAGLSDTVIMKELVLADEAVKLDQTKLSVIWRNQRLIIRQEDSFNEGAVKWGSSYSPPAIQTTLIVPRRTKLDIKNSNSNIFISGVLGDTRAESYNGNIGYEAAARGIPFYAKTTLGTLQSEIPIGIETEAKVWLKTYNGAITASAAAPPLKLTNAMFWDGQEFRNATWSVIDGVFQKDSGSATGQVLDLKGGYVLPPYGDAHCHHFDAEPLATWISGKYLVEGTLFAQSMGNHAAQKVECNKVVNQPNNMDVSYANAGITATNGHPIFTYEFLAANLPATMTQTQRSDAIKKLHTQEGSAYFRADSISDVDRIWPHYLAQDPDITKIFLVDTEEREKNKGGLAGSIGLTPEVAAAVVRKAHVAGLRVYAHVDTVEDFRIACKAGVDGLAHMPGYGYKGVAPEKFLLTPNVASLARGKVVQITLSIDDGEGQKNLPVRRTLQAQNVERLRKAGATLVIGSDSFGATTTREVKAWEEVGFTRAEILRALCDHTPRSIFPDRELGSIRDGYEGNFIVLPANPLDGKNGIFQPKVVVKKGQIVYESKQKS